MNLDQIKGNWSQFKGKLKSEFGDLSDDELKQAEGDAEYLKGVIQEKYGLSKEAAEEKLDQMLKKLS